MANVRAFLGLSTAPRPSSNWRGGPWLVIFLGIIIALPQARALVAGGILGGIVIGAALILLRRASRPSGPRRGTPITLFTQPVVLAPVRA